MPTIVNPTAEATAAMMEMNVGDNVAGSVLPTANAGGSSVDVGLALDAIRFGIVVECGEGVVAALVTVVVVVVTALVAAVVVVCVRVFWRKREGVQRHENR